MLPGSPSFTLISRQTSSSRRGLDIHFYYAARNSPAGAHIPACRRYSSAARTRGRGADYHEPMPRRLYAYFEKVDGFSMPRPAPRLRHDGGDGLCGRARLAVLFRTRPRRRPRKEATRSSSKSRAGLREGAHGQAASETMPRQSRSPLMAEPDADALPRATARASYPTTKPKLTTTLDTISRADARPIPSAGRMAPCRAIYDAYHIIGFAAPPAAHESAMPFIYDAFLLITGAASRAGSQRLVVPPFLRQYLLGRPKCLDTHSAYHEQRRHWPAAITGTSELVYDAAHARRRH